MPPDNKDFRTWGPLTNERHEREMKLHPHGQDHADVQFTDREWSNMGERENLKKQVISFAELPDPIQKVVHRDLQPKVEEIEVEEEGDEVFVLIFNTCFSEGEKRVL